MFMNKYIQSLSSPIITTTRDNTHSVIRCCCKLW